MTEDALDLRDRDRLFRTLERRTYDLLVIGGGITGAGIARDAAMRGLDVALLEARDLAAGTSSRSSKLIHGGLRYLAQGNVGLVREAASERQIVRAIAPHLALLCPFVVPARSQASLAKLRTGLVTYETLGGVPRHERHEIWSQQELAEREPMARAEQMVGAVVFPEFSTNDARLTLANARSARAHGADVATYAPVTRIVVEHGQAIGAECEDVLGLHSHQSPARRAMVRARVLVNAAGPWVDAVRALEQDGTAERLVLTKGIHVVLAHERLPLGRTVTMPAADRRGLFAVPHGAVTYIGTTDTFYSDRHYWPAIERRDVEYLLAAANRAFALGSEPLGNADVLAAWSGIRPLIGERGKKPSEISRRDELWLGPAGVLSVAGGKLTAYRRMAARAVDRVFERLSRRAPPSPTADEALVGGDFERRALEARLTRTALPEGTAGRLVDLYGAEAEAVAAAGGDVAAEARRAVSHEGALTLEDYWVRRSARAWFDADAGLAALEPAAEAMSPLLHWSPNERARQVAHCRAVHERSLAFRDQNVPAVNHGATQR